MSFERPFQDPREPYANVGEPGCTVQIHAPLPDRVQIGRFDDTATAVITDEISRGEYLERIREACVEYGDAFTLRVYDHTSTPFDAAILDGFDELRNLTIDPYDEILNPEAVARLPKLKSLSLAPRGRPRHDMLDAMGVQRLERFTLAHTSQPLLDLTPLGEAQNLRTLRMLAQGNNTEAIGRCRSLIELSMQPTEKIGLEFINELRQLQILKMSVGKIRSITSVGPLPELRDLSFHWVHTLEDLGDLQRFPKLRRLQIEDQKRLKRIVVGPANTAFEHINVETIDDIEGFEQLPALVSFYNFAGSFAPSLDALPPTLTHYAVPPTSLRKREKHFAEVHAHGLEPGPHPESQFFYK